MEDEKMTLRQAHERLSESGVNWSLGWLRTQVSLGKIPSESLYGRRLVLRSTIDRIIAEMMLIQEPEESKDEAV